MSLALACREENPDWDPLRSGSAESSDDGGELVCRDDETICDGACVDLLTDRRHCGECFTQCHPGNKRCLEGMCED
jgi:hypothetical protein